MEQIKIDLVPNGVMSVAHASQFDVGRSMKFLLTDEGVTYTLAGTEVITMKLRKPDGTDDTISLANTSSSYVEWTTVDGDLDLSGVYLAEITITSGDDVLGTANFLLKVESDPYDGKNVRTVTVGPADICSFETTLPEPYPSVTVNVVATGGYDADTQTAHPIVGYSSANITRCGVNLWDEEWENGSIGTGGVNVTDSTKVRSTDYIMVKPNTTFYIKSPKMMCIWEYDVNKNCVVDSPTGKTNATFTTGANTVYIRFRMDGSYGTTYNNDISINYPSSDTSYHAYNGNTYTIAFGQTVYGGVLDVTRGKLHVTHEKVNLYDKTWEAYASGNPNGSTFIAPFSGVTFKSWTSGGSLTAISNALAANQSGSYYEAIANSFWWNNSSDGLRCCYGLPNDPTSLAEFTQFLTDNQVIIVGELATPFDIDLTPVQIRALVGENNVFADCGETEVKYLKAE